MYLHNCTSVRNLNAPTLTIAVNQSHIDTVAMLPKHFTKWRLLQRLTGTTYHIFRRVYVLDICQMLNLSAQNHRNGLRLVYSRFTR